MNINLNDIHIFIAVINAGSFSRAATKLGLPKSTVSEKITRLETALGIRLIERSTRRLRLTQAGLIYHERCAPLILEFESFHHSLKESHHTLQGRLRIAAPILFGHAFLGDFIANFMRRYPGIEIEFMSVDRKVDMIEEGLDIAIFAVDNIPANFIVRSLGKSERLCCATPQYIQTYGTPSTPDDLLLHRCIVLGTERHATWSFLSKHKKEKKQVRVHGRLVVNSLQLTLKAALADLGIAILPSFLCHNLILEQNKLVSLFPEWSLGFMELNVVYPSKTYLKKSQRIFIEELITQFKTLSEWRIE